MIIITVLSNITISFVATVVFIGVVTGIMMRKDVLQRADLHIQVLMPPHGVMP